MIKVDKPIISPDFTIDDIHKIREYHYEITKDMSFEKRAAFYNDSMSEFKRLLAERKKEKQCVTH